MNNFRGQLTQYAEGSIQEVWAVSCPVIFSLLSVNLMIFADRLILSKHGMQTMNSAVIADLIFNLFQLGAMEIASASEIFIGQSNGAKRYANIGQIVWQVVWFSLFSTFFFIPISLFAGPYLIPSEYLAEGLPFFKWMMFFGPFFPLHAALASFFIGQGRAKLVMKVSVASNVLNILLDFILIFGIDGIIPPYGVAGAAIATGVAQMVQAFVLLFIFFRPYHRQAYGTSSWHFKKSLFWQIFQAGYPRALLSMTGLVAWSILSQIVARTSDIHITIFSIGDSFYTLFAFSFWGVQRGATAVVANYIGAARYGLINQCFKSAIKITLIIVVFFSLPLLFCSETIVKQFLYEQSAFINEELITHASDAMQWVWLYFTLDAIAWVTCGILAAVNETKYAMVLNAISTWIFLVIPNFLCLTYFNSQPSSVWMFCALSALINVVGFYLRYRKRCWSIHQISPICVP